METILEMLVPYISTASGIALFLALCQKLVRWVISMIVGGNINTL